MPQGGSVDPKQLQSVSFGSIACFYFSFSKYSLINSYEKNKPAACPALAVKLGTKSKYNLL